MNVLPAAVEAARANGGLVVAQLNARMPYTFGDGELDVGLETSGSRSTSPLSGAAPRSHDETSALIGRHVAAMVPNGATLQLGIGAVPDSTLAALTRLGTRIHSGFGGATDFLVGALHSHGGRALVALPSWHARAQVSAILPLLENPATSFQPSAVVTEHGAAAVRGRTEGQQAQSLIVAAHPDVRDELAVEARYPGLGVNGLGVDDG